MFRNLPQIQKAVVGDTLCIREWDDSLAIVAVLDGDSENITIRYSDGLVHTVKRATVDLQVRQVGTIKSAQLVGVEECKKVGDQLPKVILTFDNDVEHVWKTFCPDERWPRIVGLPGATLAEACDLAR
jgi:hypothetical protein